MGSFTRRGGYSAATSLAHASGAQASTPRSPACRGWTGFESLRELHSLAGHPHPPVTPQASEQRGPFGRAGIASVSASTSVRPSTKPRPTGPPHPSKTARSARRTAVGVERQRSGHATGPEARLGGNRTFTLLGTRAGWLTRRNRKHERATGVEQCRRNHSGTAPGALAKSHHHQARVFGDGATGDLFGDAATTHDERRGLDR